MSASELSPDWGTLQNECTLRNEDRFCECPSGDEHLDWLKVPGDLELTDKFGSEHRAESKGRQCKKRTAVILRTH